MREPADPDETIGQRLRRHRLAAGLTQTELEKLSGVSQRTISNIEIGAAAKPRLATLIPLMRALGIDLEDLQPDDSEPRGSRERELIRLWRELRPDPRAAILRLMRTWARDDEGADEAGDGPESPG